MAINASHSNIGMNSVRLTGSGDVQYRNWAYRLDGGTWRSISAGPSTSASITVSGLSANRTYSYQIQAINVVTGLMEISSTGSFTTLNATAPTVTAGVSGIGVTEFTITGSSNYACRNWEYSLNGGAWQSLSTLSGVTEVSKKITGLSEDTTYSVRVRATRTYNGVTGTSSAVSATTTKSQTAPTVACAITGVTPAGFTINGSANVDCKDWEYQLDAGVWQTLAAGTGKTKNKTLTGLTPAQTYFVRVRAKSTYNDLTGMSEIVSVSLAGNSVLNSVNTLVADDATVKLKFNITVASAQYAHRIGIYRVSDNKLMFYVTPEQLAGVTSSGNYTINLTSDQRTTLLSHMPNDKSIAVEYGMQTFYGENTVGGWSLKTGTMTTTEANSKPTFTGYLISEQNSKVTAITPGELIQNLSDIKIVCNAATAKNGASIAKYGVTIGGRTVNSATVTVDYGVPLICGVDRPISIYAEDSRGYRTTLVEAKTIWCYSKPEVLSWQTRRKDSTDTQTALRVLGVIRRVVNNTKNDLKKAEYRLGPSGGEWGSWLELTDLTNVGYVAEGSRLGFEYDKADWETLDSDKSYFVQIRYQDLYEEYSDTITTTVTQGIKLVSYREGMIGINQPNPQAALDVIGGLIVDGQSIEPINADVQRKTTSSTGTTTFPIPDSTLCLLSVSGATTSAGYFGLYLIVCRTGSPTYKYYYIHTVKARDSTTVTIDANGQLAITSSLAYFYNIVKFM